jgi:hypothetical protein
VDKTKIIYKTDTPQNRTARTLLKIILYEENRNFMRMRFILFRSILRAVCADSFPREKRQHPASLSRPAALAAEGADDVRAP